MTLLQWLEARGDYRCLFQGVNVVRRVGADLTGALLGQLAEPGLIRAAAQAAKVCNTVRLLGSPLLARQEGREDELFCGDGLILPAAGHGGQPDLVLLHAAAGSGPGDGDHARYHLFGFRPETLGLLGLG